MPVMKRGEWTTLRDSKGVKKGAAKVSMGAAFDTFDKAKKLKDQVKAANTLKGVITKYLTEVKHPDITKALNAQVSKELNPLLVGEGVFKDVADAVKVWKAFSRPWTQKNVDDLSKILSKLRDSQALRGKLFEALHGDVHSAWKWVYHEPVDKVIAQKVPLTAAMTKLAKWVE
jgi:hypothetical protein